MKHSEVEFQHFEREHNVLALKLNKYTQLQTHYADLQVQFAKVQAELAVSTTSYQQLNEKQHDTQVQLDAMDARCREQSISLGALHTEVQERKEAQKEVATHIYIYTYTYTMLLNTQTHLYRERQIHICAYV